MNTQITTDPGRPQPDPYTPRNVHKLLKEESMVIKQQEIKNYADRDHMSMKIKFPKTKFMLFNPCT